MGIEKQGSKGGFFHMFDWNAKSRKKLFSSKSDLPEQSKQKKRCDGNLPTTRLQMMEIDRTAAVSSVKEGSTCSSSVMDEDFYGSREPGVVARLMGLDSLPKSTPLFDTQSLHDNNYYYHQTRKPEYFQDQSSSSLQDLPVRSVMKKFQTEILPPKSAKSIPITHHKLLSPIKSSNFTPSKDAARVMEAATRIIRPGRQFNSEKTKMPPLGTSSSSAHLRVVEKVQSAQKPLKVSEGSQRKAEFSAVKSVRGHSTNSSNKGKSVSLALQAKANIQKRESLSANTSRSPISPKEVSPHNNNNRFKSQPNTQKNTSKKPYNTPSGPNVLRQNNQKQNCSVDRGKTPNQCVNPKGPKSKFGGNSKVSSRKLGSEVKDDKSKVVSSSGSERISHKKRSMERNYQSEKNPSVKNVKGPISWDHQDRSKMGTDVVSFTFSAPMTRMGLGPTGPADRHNNTTGGDALSLLLEEKLKELAQKVEFSQQKSESEFLHDQKDMMKEEDKDTDGMEIDSEGVLEELSMCDSNMSQVTKSLDCRLPSPVSVLEFSPFAESCNSSDTADSNCMGDSKHCFSSVNAQELLDMYSSKLFLTVERDVELSDSASSNLTICGKSRKWEIEYVMEMLFNIESMFEDYAYSSRAQGVVNSHLFNQLESSKGYYNYFGETSRTDRRLLFDCVSECLDSRCGPCASGGLKLWAKGKSVVRRKERLAEEIWKEISSRSSTGDSLTDELVDKDMSSQYGKWTDFDVEGFELGIQIESRILNSLIDEVVADILVL